MNKSKRPVALIILDGFGLTTESRGNAIHKARTPNLDTLWNNFENKGVLIKASESAVGLDTGYTGNSEVGHLTMGAGQVIPQSLQIINQSITNGSFQSNEKILKAFKETKRRGNKIHLMGILTNSGVHAHLRHLYAILDVAKKAGVDPYIQAFLDGRDTDPMDAYFFLDRLKDKMQELNIGTIASLCGRYYAMDRSTAWDRTEKAYNAMLGLEGRKFEDPVMALQHAYKNKETDETFKPTIIVDENDNPVGPVEDGDLVFFFNFREDRARQIAQAYVSKDFNGFEREEIIDNITFLSMVGYSKGLDTTVIFPPVHPPITVSEILEEKQIKQFHIAETEKYAHVTYFFNGGQQEPHEYEQFIKIDSPKVKDYVDAPAMSAYQLRDRVLEELENNSSDFYLINFANPDMIGHTGDLEATVKAVEVTDECVGKIVHKILQLNGSVILTADHGNCEHMINLKNNQPDKAHTLNNVPFLIADDKNSFSQFYKLYEDGLNSPKTQLPTLEQHKVGYPEDEPPTGILADVGTTVLYMLGIEPPAEMSGIDLSKATS
jgi:2,3-bisphosphoglycerate-independent phosphoglycerate mutase